jgi:hypothetical protein
MEELSRRVLVALAVGAAGPAAAMLTVLLLAPSLVIASSPDSDGTLADTTGSLLVGLFLGTMVASALAYLAAAAATLLALRVSGCPRHIPAFLLCLALSPVWLAFLSSLALDVRTWLVLAGALPSVVRLGFAYLAPDRGSPEPGAGQLPLP